MAYVEVVSPVETFSSEGNVTVGVPNGVLALYFLLLLATTLGAEAAKPDPYAYGEPISIPELTTVTVSVTRKAGDAVLEIIYDVAL